MALIQCPECKNNISDQAERCPKCGYELKSTEAVKSQVVEKSDDINDNKPEKKFRGKINYTYIILGLLIIVVGFFMLNQRNNNNGENTGTTSAQVTGSYNQPTDNVSGNGYIVYNDTNLGIQYEIPESYKAVSGDGGVTYLGQNISSEKFVFPYVVLAWSADYNDPVQFFNAFTDELRKLYSNVTMTTDLLSSQLGNYYVYGIAYQYTSNGYTIVDNRYATVINGKLLVVGSLEENVNTNEMNDVVRGIFNSLKGGN